MSSGGVVRGNDKIRRSGNNNEDTILALLEPGQLVIPREAISRALPYIRKIGGPTGPLVKDKNKLERVILQTDEIVAHKSKSSKIEDYLKSKYGLTLPYNESSFM
jgi:hypothetical protein